MEEDGWMERREGEERQRKGEKMKEGTEEEDREEGE